MTDIPKSYSSSMIQEALKQQQKAETLKKEKEILPIRVVCVLNSETDWSNKTLSEVRFFCNEKGLIFESRYYNSAINRYDRDVIERLPAFHIYLNSIYERTFYPNTRPFQHILEVIQLHSQRIQKRLARKNRFKGLLLRIIKKIKNLTHKKTRLEKVAEHELEHPPRRECIRAWL